MSDKPTNKPDLNAKPELDTMRMKRGMLGLPIEPQTEKRDTRFKKGQSGNPNGRPKKAAKSQASPPDELAIDQSILAFANRELTVSLGGETVTMSAVEALIQAQAKSGLAGNPISLRDFFNRVERAQQKEQTKRAERAELWRSYKERCYQELEQLSKQGVEPKEDQYLPHPDDVEIEYDNTIRFKGPIDEDQLKEVKQRMLMRDAFMLQGEYDARTVTPEDGRDPDQNGAFLYAYLLEQRLPARMRMSEGKMLYKLMRAECLSKRELLKQLRAAWDKALRGSPNYKPGSMKRGLNFPDLDTTKDLLLDLADYQMDITQPDQPPSQEEAQDLYEIIKPFSDEFVRLNGKGK